jgi:uncharacterized repeat protein (TIGR03803 family)
MKVSLFPTSRLAGTRVACSVFLVVALLVATTLPRHAHAGWNIDTLHKFTGGLLFGGLLMDSAGRIYGTEADSNSPYGTVFRLDPPTKNGDAWSVVVLHKFTGGTDGSYAWGSLIADSNGNLYGITTGAIGHKAGSVFELSPPPKGVPSWTVTPLYDFTGGTDGGTPYGDLIRDDTGVIYGTTYEAGLNHDCDGGGCGVVFRLTPPPKGKTHWTETVLHEFTGGTDGANPFGGVVMDRKGVLYGTTYQGGSIADYGTVYSLTPPAQGKTAWHFKVLHIFSGGADGGYPNASLTLDASGALYGTTIRGGSLFYGTVFKLAPAAGKAYWAETVLHNFSAQPDGQTPQGNLIFDEAGALYGTTFLGGTDGVGMVFKLSPPAKGKKAWTEEHLYDFAGGFNSDGPSAGLIFDKNHSLYGTTSGNVLNDGGTVFKLTPP